MFLPPIKNGRNQSPSLRGPMQNSSEPGRASLNYCPSSRKDRVQPSRVGGGSLARIRIALLLSVCMAVVGGCGSNPHPELRRVSGTVTYNGEPVADATVAFYNNASSRLATGRTDATGQFSLTSYNPQDGALPGEHRVVVTKSESSGDEEVALSMDEAVQTRPKRTRSRQLLPKEYGSEDTTPIVVQVSEDGQNDLKIELVDN